LLKFSRLAHEVGHGDLKEVRHAEMRLNLRALVKVVDKVVFCVGGPRIFVDLEETSQEVDAGNCGLRIMGVQAKDVQFFTAAELGKGRVEPGLGSSPRQRDTLAEAYLLRQLKVKT
jgi:hypothetical protein